MNKDCEISSNKAQFVAKRVIYHRPDLQMIASFWSVNMIENMIENVMSHMIAAFIFECTESGQCTYYLDIILTNLSHEELFEQGSSPDPLCGDPKNSLIMFVNRTLYDWFSLGTVCVQF